MVDGSKVNYSISHIDKNNIEEPKQLFIGKTVRILFPIIIQEVKNEYVFEFRVEDIIQKK